MHPRSYTQQKKIAIRKKTTRKDMYKKILHESLAACSQELRRSLACGDAAPGVNADDVGDSKGESFAD